MCVCVEWSGVEWGGLGDEERLGMKVEADEKGECEGKRKKVEKKAEDLFSKAARP